MEKSDDLDDDARFYGPLDHGGAVLMFKKILQWWRRRRQLQQINKLIQRAGPGDPVWGAVGEVMAQGIIDEMERRKMRKSLRPPVRPR